MTEKTERTRRITSEPIGSLRHRCTNTGAAFFNPDRNPDRFFHNRHIFSYGGDGTSITPYQEIAPAFSSDIRVIQVINTFIYILPLTYGAHAVVILVMVSLNVLRRPRLALFLIIIRLIALYLPLAYIGGLYWGITGLFSGAAIGNVIAAVIAYRVIRKVCAAEGGMMPATAVS